MWHGEITRRVEPTSEELELLKPHKNQKGFSPSHSRGFTYHPGVKTFPLRWTDLPDQANLVEFENVQIVREKSDTSSTYLYWSFSLRVQMFSPRHDEPDDLKPRGKGWSFYYKWSDIDSVSVLRNKGYQPPHDIVNPHLNEATTDRYVSGRPTLPRVGHPQQIIDDMAAAPIPVEITRAFAYAASQHDEHCWWDQLNNTWQPGPVEIVLPV